MRGEQRGSVAVSSCRAMLPVTPDADTVILTTQSDSSALSSDSEIGSLISQHVSTPLECRKRIALSIRVDRRLTIFYLSCTLNRSPGELYIMCDDILHRVCDTLAYKRKLCATLSFSREVHHHARCMGSSGKNVGVLLI